MESEMTLNDESTETFDTTRRFVRLTQIRPDGFVEFDFAIGEPEIFVEMILSEPAYNEFCAANSVEMLPANDPDSVADPDDLRVRLSEVPPA